MIRVKTTSSSEKALSVENREETMADMVDVARI